MDGLTWRKSRHSDVEGACVEVAALPKGAAVRDSKHPAGDVLAFTPRQLNGLLARVRSGDLDL
jgi:hypothetical protein